MDTTQPNDAKPVEKLAYTGDEVNEILGGISSVTRWRLEKKGLLKRVPGIGRPLYSRKAVMALLNSEVPTCSPLISSRGGGRLRTRSPWSRC